MLLNFVVSSPRECTRYAQAQAFADRYGYGFSDGQAPETVGYTLRFDDETVNLCQRQGKKTIFSQVDFVGGPKAHRRKFGGGKGQAIAKAVGLNKTKQLTVLDATAGMGGDAFVLASLGCEVTLVERSPVVRALLADGISRALASDDEELQVIVARMHLIEGDSIDYLQRLEPASFNVVYLDPMFPQRKKSAEVKKEMQFFHDIVGDDADADSLLSPALNIAENRVVVKRPKVAPYLAAHEPGYQLLGKANRFDIYPLKAFGRHLF